MSKRRARVARLGTSTSYFRYFTPLYRSMARSQLHTDSFNLLQRRITTVFCTGVSEEDRRDTKERRAISRTCEQREDPERTFRELFKSRTCIRRRYDDVYESYLRDSPALIRHRDC